MNDFQKTPHSPNSALEKLAFKGMDLIISGDKTVSFVGATGQGKTTTVENLTTSSQQFVLIAGVGH